MRAVLLLLALCACAKTEKGSHQLDVNKIEVVDNARLRTDTVGDKQFASTSTFVLVDAKNPTAEGAYVTLAGDLTGDAGKVVGHLKAQSIWIPPGETRTFALIDTERVPRPETTSARIVVTGALVTPDPPRVHVSDLALYQDNGRTVAQANVINDADRIGKVIVIAAFHDDKNRPMTRPFQVLEIDKHQTTPVQFVGPDHSTQGTIFVGDVIY
ncbi:MAG TPA: hypothetical protein VGM39_16480 [Kofleriaceae bacterium]|jgi:hypothetical protein